MEVIKEGKIFKRESRKKQDHEVIFGMEYYINFNLKIKCGFSTTRNFKPMIWIQQEKNYIGLDRDEWIYLMAYKEYIQLKLDHHKFLSPDTILSHPSIQEKCCDFVYKKDHGQCVFILKHNGNFIEFESNSWKELIRIGIFISTYLCWNTILQKQIFHFYHNQFIPTCVELKKNCIKFSEINGVYSEEVKVDLTRLCFEISRKMQIEIKNDIKMYKLLLRTKIANKDSE